MNANKLADMLEEEHYYAAATMLRQQQAEIEALKQIIDANNLSQNIGQFVKPANKPKIVDMCLRTDANGNVLPQREIK